MAFQRLLASIQVLDEEISCDHRNIVMTFEVGIKIVNRIARNVLSKGLPEGVDLLNINIPKHVNMDTEIEINPPCEKDIPDRGGGEFDPRAAVLLDKWRTYQGMQKKELM